MSTASNLPHPDHLCLGTQQRKIERLAVSMLMFGGVFEVTNPAIRPDITQ
jgi:hypothetical protein